TQPSALLGLEDHLHESFGVTAGRRFTAGRKRQCAHFDVVTGFFRGFFGETYRGHLRLALGTAWYVALVDGLRRQARELLDEIDALVRGFVGQPRGADDITDGIYAFHLGGVGVAVHLDHAAFGFHADFVEVEAFHIAGHTHGRQNDVGFDGLGT